MSANDARTDASVREEILRDERIRTKAVKETADARQKIIEAAQFERGYN